jgi:septum formation protein
MFMKSVLLASTSPRRSQLLSQIGVPFTVVSPDYEEDMTQTMPVDDLAWNLALGKASSVHTKAEPHHVIVAADTFIEFEGALLGKPGTPERAIEMLHMLRGKTNVVQTGYALINVDSDERIVGTVSSYIQMRNYSDEEVEKYVATGEPLDKAGAYAINGVGAMLIDRVVDGDFSAVIGLPLGPVAQGLQRFGVKVL